MTNTESGQSAPPSGQPPAGWYPVPEGRRYWDGQRWTEHVAPSESAAPTLSTQTLFDRPLYKDWIVYLVAFALFAVWRPGGAGNTFDSSSFGITSGLFDLVLSGGFQFLLFGLIPASIRRSLRRSRARKGATGRRAQ